MKKIIALALATVMVLSLAACGKKEDEAAKAAAAAEEAGFTTCQPGKLIMATDPTFQPYEYVDEDGETIIGIDAEIAKMIADELGLELQIVGMEFGSIIPAVQNGEADIGIAAMTVTEERLQSVNFTSTYARSVQSVIVSEDSDIESVDDLEGYIIGVKQSTTGHIYADGEFGEENIIAYPNGPALVQAILKGSVDCGIIDNDPAQIYVNDNEGLRLLDSAYAEEDYAGAVSKDNEALLAAINKVLDAKIADGTVQQIIDKYISAE